MEIGVKSIFRLFPIISIPQNFFSFFFLTLEKIGIEEKVIFRLFPIISISQKFFSIFFLTLEKIGIDGKVICYHNISN